MEQVYAGKPNFVDNIVEEMVRHVTNSPTFESELFDKVTSQLEFRTIGMQLTRQSGRTRHIMNRVLNHEDSIVIFGPSDQNTSYILNAFNAQHLMGVRAFTRGKMNMMAKNNVWLNNVKRVYIHSSISHRGYFQMVRDLLAVINGTFIIIKM